MGRLRPRRLARLLRDERGGSLVEFALIGPFMIFLLIGSVEIVQAVEAQRRVSHAAYAVADLVTQARTVGPESLGAFETGGRMMMAPIDSAGLGLRVISIVSDEQGNLTADWSRDSGYAGSEPAGLEAGALEPNTSAIVVDASYEYEPITNLLLNHKLKFQKRAVLRPRRVEKVAYDVRR